MPRPAPPPRTTVVVTNRKAAPVVVYVTFGSDSKVTAKDWSSFCAGSGLACSFSLGATTSRPLPTNGAYLNATFAFGAPVGCGVTKGEVNVNNPAWFDTMDVSLVDGFNHKVGIVYTPPASADAGGAVALGPPLGAAGNEKVLGVYPFGCDVCVARQSPPCGIPVGKDGCKAGTQSNPSPPCQVQGAVKGGGGAVEVILFP